MGSLLDSQKPIFIRTNCQPPFLLFDNRASRLVRVGATNPTAGSGVNRGTETEGVSLPLQEIGQANRRAPPSFAFFALAVYKQHPRHLRRNETQSCPVSQCAMLPQTFRTPLTH